MEDGVEGSTWETFREDEVEAKVALEALPVFQKREAIEARAEAVFYGKGTDSELGRSVSMRAWPFHPLSNLA